MTFQALPFKHPFFTGKRTPAGRSVFKGTDKDDQIVTTPKNNVINGWGGNDTIKAGAGDDVVFGQKGNDVLYGGEGDDIINGGVGNDTLFGGSGADTFFINQGQSIIKDFDFAEGDSLKFGRYLTNIRYEQDGDDVLVQSNKGTTIILNNDINDFI